MEISRTNIMFRQPPATASSRRSSSSRPGSCDRRRQNTKPKPPSITVPGPWPKLRPRTGRDQAQAPNAKQGPQVALPPLLPSYAGKRWRGTYPESWRHHRTPGPRCKHRHGPQSVTRCPCCYRAGWREPVWLEKPVTSLKIESSVSSFS